MLQVPPLRTTIHKSMEENPMVENGKTTTIEISIDTYNKLHSCQDNLQKILRKKKVSFDQVLAVMFACTKLNDTLLDMQMEN
jgi:hypothetical protein